MMILRGSSPEDCFRAGAGEWLEICIPSNYGRIWTVEGGE